MKDVKKVSFVIIGTTIGAGFASGQEIQLFFNHYGIIRLIRNDNFLYINRDYYLSNF